MDVGHAAELLYLLALKDLRVRYKNSLLGYLWALGNPLAFTVVYYIAFQMIMRVDVPNYPLYLVTGMFPWAWMANTLVQATGAYRGNPSLVRKVKMSRTIIPLSIAVQQMVHFVFALPILLGCVVVFLGTAHVGWVASIPVMILVELAVLYPISVLLAALNALVRDVEYLVGIALQMLFFLTPVVYAPSAIPGDFRRYFAINPFSPLIDGWRSALYDGVLDWPAVGRCCVFAGLAGVVAFAVHRAIEPRIGELL